MPAPERTVFGYRDCDATALERLAFIRQAQTAGLTLQQIRQILDIGDDGTPPCHVASVVTERLADIEARIAELRATRSHLRRLAERAAQQDPSECKGFCSIITADN